ncbi:hypothetical protein FO519_001180 [Halicephalobus sp. NKZ332]|nr:hypothetical protein FO519_001180 [Halicephalobus sp. NKZ332]
MSAFSLSPGSKRGIQLIQQIPASKLIKISESILSNLPSTKIPSALEKDPSISNESNLSNAEFTLAVKTLISLWKQVVFHAMKPGDFQNELEGLEFNQGCIDSLVQFWTSNGEATLSRLRSRSCSGVPEFKELNWGIAIERANTFEPKKREVKAMIAIDTSDGKKFTKLNFEQLQKLHYDLQTVQNRMDSITR